jgi:hypothetical protein
MTARLATQSYPRDDMDATDEPAAGMMNVHCNGVTDYRISCTAREEE